MLPSDAVLGNGRLDDIRDSVVVDFHRFERARSRDVARESRGSTPAPRQSVPYLLIGVGRWGSSEPCLGIPVSWDQISGARVIVEAGFRDFRVTPSQGTHFFQNLTPVGVGYFTVNPERARASSTGTGSRRSRRSRRPRSYATCASRRPSWCGERPHAARRDPEAAK